MSYSAGQLANRLHPAGLHEGGLAAQLVRDVAHHFEEAELTAIHIIDHGPHGGAGKDLAVTPAELQNQ